MRKLFVTFAIAAAILFAGSLAWKADAVTWTGSSRMKAAEQNYTPFDNVACRGFGRFCGPGFTRVCGPYRCWCRPCR